MKLLDRYLQEVRPLLPKQQRDDILTELSEEIRAQLEDKETELGRPLTDAEEEAVLDRYGPPLVVAGRYREQQGSLTFGKWVLIGPELFPFYMKALRIVGAITFAAAIVISAALTIWKPSALSGVISTLVYWLALQFGIQTFVWSALQANYRKNPQAMRPPRTKAKADRNSPLAIRVESIVQIGVAVVLIPWLHGILMPQHVGFGPGELTPIFHSLYPIVMAVMAGQLIQGVVSLVYPGWLTFRAVAKVLLSMASLGVMSYLLASGPWLVLANRAGNVAANQKGVDAINHFMIFYVLIGFVSGLGVQLVIDLRRLFTMGK